MRAFPSIFAASLLLGISALHAQYTHVVAFGDSLTDQGNTIELLKFFGEPAMKMAEYDMDYYHSSYTVGGVTHVSQGRFSNGPTWVDYVNGKVLGGASAVQPVALGRNDGFIVTGGTNYAWAGATSADGGSLLIGTDLNLQIARYLGNTTQSTHASSTLFTVWAGGNDAINWVKSMTPELSGPLQTIDPEDPLTPQAPPPGPLTLEDATTQAVEGIVTAIHTLYDAGGRSILLPNLPALGFKPDFRLDERGQLANDFAELFNLKLSVALGNLDLADLNLIELDIYSLFNDVLADPSAYGFTNTTDMAFTFHEDGSDIATDWEGYVFWDNTHPSGKMHELIGSLAYQAISPIPEPSTYALIGAGAVLGFGLLRRRAA